MLILAGVLGLLAGILWWQLPAIANWGLTQVLQQQGLTNINLQIGQVGGSKASVKRLAATYAGTDTMLQIQLQDATLDYTLSQLINGQADKLVVDQVTLKLDKQSNQQASASSTLPTIEQLLAAHNIVGPLDIPLTRIRLQNISISHNLLSEPEFAAVELMAELTRQENQLAAELLFANQQQLNLSSQPDNAWKIEFIDTPAQVKASQQDVDFEEPDPGQVIFQATLKQVEQSLVFSADIKPRLITVLQHWLPIAQQFDSSIELSEIALSGAIQASLSLSLIHI